MSDLLVSIIIGNLTAISSLFFLHFVFRPAIKFSSILRVDKSGQTGFGIYSIKTVKLGYIDLIETKIGCRVAIKDIRRTGSNVWTYFDIPTTFDTSSRVKRGFRIIHLQIQKASIAINGHHEYFDKYVNYGYPEQGLRLEDIFLAYPETHIMVYIIGHDRFTGIKKLFTSNKYYFHSLRSGDWEQINMSTNFLTDHNE